MRWPDRRAAAMRWSGAGAAAGAADLLLVVEVTSAGQRFHFRDQGAAELRGRCRPHPLCRNAETGLLAALALRRGGQRGALKAQQKLSPLTTLVVLTRAQG